MLPFAAPDKHGPRVSKQLKPICVTQSTFKLLGECLAGRRHSFSGRQFSPVWVDATKRKVETAWGDVRWAA